MFKPFTDIRSKFAFRFDASWIHIMAGTHEVLDSNSRAALFLYGYINSRQLS